MNEKRCVDCGIIFYTFDSEQERCDLCEDDRQEEEDNDSDYIKNYHRIRIYSRRYLNSKPGLLRDISGILIRAMNWVNENLIGGGK